MGYRTEGRVAEMSICRKCKVRIRKGSANKIKVRGVWLHKKCPKALTLTSVEHNREMLNKIKAGTIA